MEQTLLDRFNASLKPGYQPVDLEKVLELSADPSKALTVTREVYLPHFFVRDVLNWAAKRYAEAKGHQPDIHEAIAHLQLEGRAPFRWSLLTRFHDPRDIIPEEKVEDIDYEQLGFIISDAMRLQVAGHLQEIVGRETDATEGFLIDRFGLTGFKLEGSRITGDIPDALLDWATVVYVVNPADISVVQGPMTPNEWFLSRGDQLANALGMTGRIGRGYFQEGLEKLRNMPDIDYQTVRVVSPGVVGQSRECPNIYVATNDIMPYYAKGKFKLYNPERACAAMDELESCRISEIEGSLRSMGSSSQRR